MYNFFLNFKLSLSSCQPSIIYKPSNYSSSFYHLYAASLYEVRFYEQIPKQAQHRQYEPASIVHYVVWTGLKDMLKLNK